MHRKDRLIQSLAMATAAGGGIHTAHELAYMISEQNSPAFKKFLADRVSSGTLRRIAKGIYESTLTPPDPTTAIYKIINKLRPGQLNYISLESQLSYSGEISQVIMGRVTAMTKGRSGTFTTPYGIIELIHTKKPVSEIMPSLYFDPSINMYRADTNRATTDLKNCNRNTHMLVNSGE